jgi:hypothetical protein
MHVGIMVLIIGSGIITSRKRKLREFFAVCDNDEPIPQINLSNVDAPPTNAAEAYFLEVTDILQYVALSICGVLKFLRFLAGVLGGSLLILYTQRPTLRRIKSPNASTIKVRYLEATISYPEGKPGRPPC